MHFTDVRLELQVHNPVTPSDGKSWARDPVTLALSSDGFTFDSAFVALTCHDLGGCSPRCVSKCWLFRSVFFVLFFYFSDVFLQISCAIRFAGHAKNPGPSYPQAITLVDPAPTELQGLYVVSSNNKEDIWITKFEYSKL